MKQVHKSHDWIRTLALLVSCLTFFFTAGPSGCEDNDPLNPDYPFQGSIDILWGPVDCGDKEDITGTASFDIDGNEVTHSGLPGPDHPDGEIDSGGNLIFGASPTHKPDRRISGTVSFMEDMDGNIIQAKIIGTIPADCTNFDVYQYDLTIPFEGVDD